MANKAQPVPWFDETLIEEEHDKVVSSSPELNDHLFLIYRAFDLIHIALRKHPYEGNDEALIVLRLAARVFNTAGAALKLARAGYFQPAFTMVRDILEIEFLTDLFSRDRKHLQRWISLDENARKREFKQVTIRDTLDQIDGFTTKKRAEAYKLLSTHAAHADPDGFQVISPQSMTQIGPFPSEHALTAFFQEFAKHFQMACIHIVTLLHPVHPEIIKAKDAFEEVLISWRAKYIPQ
jgi:hypothetical protein